MRRSAYTLATRRLAQSPWHSTGVCLAEYTSAAVAGSCSAQLSFGKAAIIASRRATTSFAVGLSLGSRFHMSWKSCGRNAGRGEGEKVKTISVGLGRESKSKSKSKSESKNRHGTLWSLHNAFLRLSRPFLHFLPEERPALLTQSCR